MVLTDPCLKMPTVFKTYMWHYDEHLGFLSIYPKSKQLSLPAQKLWSSFLKVHSYPFEESSNHFIFHADTVQTLINFLKPRFTWLCVEPTLMFPILQKNVFISPTAEYWLEHPFSKKHVWQLWQKMLSSAA